MRDERVPTLLERYRGLVCDLDGVVYRGPDAVAYAVETLSAATITLATGEHPGVVYATNNASRPPQEVAHHLTGLGLSTAATQVVTSSQAGARHLLATLGEGARVLVVGGVGVSAALEECALEPVPAGDCDDPGSVAGVLQGYGPGVTADDLARASYAIEAGAAWVATNTDATLPTDKGVAPGNGMLVAAVARATGTDPVVVGKPLAPLYHLASSRLGVEGVLAIGDRLDTDILGAQAAGLDSLWVLTGVDDLASFARSGDRPSPTWVAPDLRALGLPAPSVRRDGDWWVSGAWRLRVADGVSVEVGTTGGDRPASAPAHGRLERSVALLTAGVRLMCHERDTTDGGRDRLGSLASAIDGVVG